MAKIDPDEVPCPQCGADSITHGHGDYVNAPGGDPDETMHTTWWCDACDWALRLTNSEITFVLEFHGYGED